MEEILKFLPELSDEAKAELEKALNDQYEKGRADLLSQQEKDAFDTAISAELEKCGALDMELVRSVMDMENIIFEEGSFLGLDEEICRIKGEYGFLFRQDCPQFSGMMTSGKDVDISSMNYLERLKLYRENPGAYRMHCGK